MITTRSTTARGRALALLMLLSAVVVAGCASEPLQRVEQIELSYGASLDVAHALVDTGVIQPGTPTALTLDAARQEADAAIAELSRLSIASEPIRREFYIERAASAAARFAMVLTQVQEQR